VVLSILAFVYHATSSSLEFAALGCVVSVYPLPRLPIAQGHPL
jgi:hypothetical protein